MTFLSPRMTFSGVLNKSEREKERKRERKRERERERERESPTITQKSRPHRT